MKDFLTLSPMDSVESIDLTSNRKYILEKAKEIGDDEIYYTIKDCHRVNNDNSKKDLIAFFELLNEDSNDNTFKKVINMLTKSQEVYFIPF